MIRGYLESLGFWRHFQWQCDIQTWAAKEKSNNTVRISALEYLVLILNYKATTAALQHQPWEEDPFPPILLFTDNMASEIWIIKGAKKSPPGKALGQLQCCLMINNPMGINTDWVSTTDNIIANCISRFSNHDNPFPHFLSLAQDFLLLQNCKHFHPNAELVSYILYTAACKVA